MTLYSSCLSPSFFRFCYLGFSHRHCQPTRRVTLPSVPVPYPSFHPHVPLFAAPCHSPEQPHTPLSEEIWVYKFGRKALLSIHGSCRAT